MTRPLASFLIACLCAASLAANPGEADYPDNVQIDHASVLELMNLYRAMHGIEPLKRDARLDAAADDRMHDMEDQGYWGHESPLGMSPFVWFSARDYQYRYAGENLARGFETTKVLMSGWMESSGHRDNILDSDFTDCGIAIIEGSTTGRAYGRSIVVLFGSE